MNHLRTYKQYSIIMQTPLGRDFIDVDGPIPDDEIDSLFEQECRMMGINPKDGFAYLESRMVRS